MELVKYIETRCDSLKGACEFFPNYRASCENQLQSGIWPPSATTALLFFGTHQRTVAWQL